MAGEGGAERSLPLSRQRNRRDRADAQVWRQRAPCPLHTRSIPPMHSRAHSGSDSKTSTVSCGNSGWSTRAVRPSRPSTAAGLTACARLYQQVTATRYQRLCFLSRLTACCFFLKTWVHLCLPKLWTHGDICVILRNASVFASNGKLELPRKYCQDPLLFSFFIPVISKQKQSDYRLLTNIYLN